MKRQVKVLIRLVVCMAFLLIVTLMAGCGTELTERSIDGLQSLDMYTEFIVINNNGSVTVDTYNLPGIRVETERKATASTREEAQALLDMINIVLSQNSAQTKVQTVVPRFGLGETVTTNLHISMPRNFAGRLNVTTGNGEVRVYNIDGAGHITTSNGAVMVENYEGSLALQTSNGSITVKNSHITGSSSFTTSNGGINLTLAELSGNVVGMSFNGYINLTVPMGTGMYLDTNATNGSTKLVRGSLVREMQGRVLETLNNGGPSVTLQTLNGQIKIEER